MKRFIAFWASNAAALGMAALLLGANFEIAVGEVGWDRQLISLLLASLIFTLVNMILGPIIKVLAIPFIVVTFGIALLFINAGLLMLTEWLANMFSLPMEVNGYWWAMLASVIISITNGILQTFMRDE